MPHLVHHAGVRVVGHAEHACLVPPREVRFAVAVALLHLVCGLYRRLSYSALGYESGILGDTTEGRVCAALLGAPNTVVFDTVDPFHGAAVFGGLEGSLLAIRVLLLHLGALVVVLEDPEASPRASHRVNGTRASLGFHVGSPTHKLQSSPHPAFIIFAGYISYMRRS